MNRSILVPLSSFAAWNKTGLENRKSEDPAQLQQKFSTIKFALSNFYCRGVFPRKQAFLDDFPLCPQAPPPSKAKMLFLLSSRRLWKVTLRRPQKHSVRKWLGESAKRHLDPASKTPVALERTRVGCTWVQTTFSLKTLSGEGPKSPLITLWHEIIAKIIPWELFFVILRHFALSESPGNKDSFKELRVKFVILWK